MPKASVSAAGGAKPAAKSNRDHAQRWRDLEGAICDAKFASLVLDIVSDDALGMRSRALTDDIKKRIPGLENYVLYLLTEEQADALDYARHHVGDCVRKLVDEYCEGE